MTVRGAGSEGDVIDSDYYYESDEVSGAGKFYYALRQDFTPGVFGTGFQREELLSIAQWNGERAGRVDAVVRGGDLGDFQYNAVHCWDEDFITLLSFDDDDAHETVGEIGDCLFDVPPPIPVLQPIFE
ncbi:MAG: hypothetical protein GY822_11140 [Deltaproteobacteria bacterium]|nr:hypothetical protein [Deltaproteobacteria bacterium]